MARKRMIDPSIWADESFGNLSGYAMVLFIGIISNADDEGKLPGNALFLTSTIMPFKGFTQKQANDLLDEVVKNMPSVVIYSVDGKDYIQLQKWAQYQTINRPSLSKYPQFTEDSLRTHGGLTPNRIEKNRIEKNRKEEKGNSSQSFIEILDNIEFLEKLKKQFPNISVEEEIESMKDWLLSKGEKRKDYAAFARNWLRKSKPKSNGKGGVLVIRE